MEFFDYLKETYGVNKPILYSTITFRKYSKPWIKKALQKLCEEGSIIRFEKGVYYIPTNTIIGKSKLDYKSVITKKYINDGKEKIGYFSGITFMNIIGLSTQMPNTLEIYTNNETSKVREVSVGNKRVIVRRSRVKINSDNVATLSFLELMNFTEASFFDDDKKQIVKNFIQKNGITRNLITKYSPYFPDKAMRTLIESELIYNVA